MQGETGKQEPVDQFTVNHNDNRKKYICDSCGLTLFSRRGIRRHIMHKHVGIVNKTRQVKTEVCTICGVYVTKNNFKDHVNSHSTARNYKCELCGNAVKSIFTLRKHIKRVHKKIKAEKKVDCERKFQCEFCDHRYARIELLKTHLIKHKDHWTYECGLCSKIFKHSSSVSGHRRLHKVNGLYHCGCCDDRFKDYAQLKIHFLNSKHKFDSKTKQ